jgi:hypothetical protein
MSIEKEAVRLSPLVSKVPVSVVAYEAPTRAKHAGIGNTSYLLT